MMRLQTCSLIVFFRVGSGVPVRSRQHRSSAARLFFSDAYPAASSLRVGRRGLSTTSPLRGSPAVISLCTPLSHSPRSPSGYIGPHVSQLTLPVHPSVTSPCPPPATESSTVSLPTASESRSDDVVDNPRRWSAACGATESGEQNAHPNSWSRGARDVV